MEALPQRFMSSSRHANFCMQVESEEQVLFTQYSQMSSRLKYTSELQAVRVSPFHEFKANLLTLHCTSLHQLQQSAE